MDFGEMKDYKSQKLAEQMRKGKSSSGNTQKIHPEQNGKSTIDDTTRINLNNAGDKSDVKALN